MEFYRGRGSARIDSASVELRLMSMLLLGRRHSGTSTQGGEITRVTRVFLPWAMMFIAFGVFIGFRKTLSSIAPPCASGYRCFRQLPSFEHASATSKRARRASVHLCKVHSCTCIHIGNLDGLSSFTTRQVPPVPFAQVGCPVPCCSAGD